MQIDLYKYFGINKTATKEEIKKAYRKKAKKLHPDYNPDIDQVLFDECNKYYKILIKDNLRADYDKTGDVSSVNESNENSIIMSMLAQAFERIIQNRNYDLKTENVFDLMINGMNNEVEEFNQKIEKSKELLKEADDIIDRISMKTDDVNENIFIQIMIGKKENVNKEVVVLKKRIKQLNSAIDILKGYEYRVDEDYVDFSFNRNTMPEWVDRNLIENFLKKEGNKL